MSEPAAGRKQLSPRLAFAALFSVTFLTMLSVGSTLPIMPRYVQGPIGAGDIAVGVVTGAFAITGLACRPLAGSFADSRGRRPVVQVGALVMAIASALYFIPAGVPGLIVARLLLGAGEGMVYTAGAAWIVDIAPVERRGRIIGLYGLAIWGGLSFGAPIGELLLRAGSYDLVWAFAILSPLLALMIASRLPRPHQAFREPDAVRGSLWARESFAPGRLPRARHLRLRGARRLRRPPPRRARHRPRRRGLHRVRRCRWWRRGCWRGTFPTGWEPPAAQPARRRSRPPGSSPSGSPAPPPSRSLGAVAMGAAFSTIFPSLALLVINRIDDDRRGIAMGTFTACFDIGVGLGAPIAGAAAALGGYALSFYVAAGFAADRDDPGDSPGPTDRPCRATAEQRAGDRADLSSRSSPRA